MYNTTIIQKGHQLLSAFLRRARAVSSNDIASAESDSVAAASEPSLSPLAARASLAPDSASEAAGSAVARRAGAVEETGLP